jgi:hypothetical protein
MRIDEIKWSYADSQHTIQYATVYGHRIWYFQREDRYIIYEDDAVDPARILKWANLDAIDVQAILYHLAQNDPPPEDQ